MKTFLALLLSLAVPAAVLAAESCGDLEKAKEKAAESKRTAMQKQQDYMKLCAEVEEARQNRPALLPPLIAMRDEFKKIADEKMALYRMDEQLVRAIERCQKGNNAAPAAEPAATPEEGS